MGGYRCSWLCILVSIYVYTLRRRQSRVTARWSLHWRVEEGEGEKKRKEERKIKGEERTSLRTPFPRLPEQ